MTQPELPEAAGIDLAAMLLRAWIPRERHEDRATLLAQLARAHFPSRQYIANVVLCLVAGTLGAPRPWPGIRRPRANETGIAQLKHIA